jgi:hypothetical protein
LGLSCYETAFQILHKLRAGMVRPDQDRIGGKLDELGEADETYVGGRTRGKGRGVHDMVLVAGAVEVRQRKRTSSSNKRKTGRYAGRVRLALVPAAASRVSFPMASLQRKQPSSGLIIMFSKLVTMAANRSSFLRIILDNYNRLIYRATIAVI